MTSSTRVTGSSERGLSEVITARLARAAAAPRRGRLAGSRSPAAPTTTMTDPPAMVERRIHHRFDRLRRMGVVDQNSERLSHLHRVESSPDPLDRRKTLRYVTCADSHLQGTGGRHRGVAHVYGDRRA